MSNPLIPRHTVHAWSEEIGVHAMQHSSSLQRLLKDQRRLTRFIEQNADQMTGGTSGVCVYLTGVIARMFEMGGGRLRKATWGQIRAAEAKVHGHLDALLPLDDEVLDRLHAITDRAQGHVLDEAAMVLFEADPSEEEQQLDRVEALKVLLVCWVITEVLDANWKPPASFEGDDTYTYVHIEPTPPKPPEVPDPEVPDEG